MKYGNLPKDLGEVKFINREMMFWMYLPISTPGVSGYSLPDNVMKFWPLVELTRNDALSEFIDRYVYLTAKTLWVAGDYIGNRPGWHSDGFGTDDLNFIWCDRAPTEFIDCPIDLPQECDSSMRMMETVGNYYASLGRLVTYPDRHLLRLDETVIHRSPTRFDPGMRTFVKISLSKDRYDLVGNSVNHRLPNTHWPLYERRTERNHPSSSPDAPS